MRFSPLLLAVAADLLLRRLRGDLPSITLRAYADDTALVDPKLLMHVAPLEHTFSEYARVSSLELEVIKTVSFPLGALSLQPTAKV